jgi:hypothetical protein
MSQEFLRHFQAETIFSQYRYPAAYWCQRVESSNYSDVSQASWFEAVLLANHFPLAGKQMVIMILAICFPKQFGLSERKNLGHSYLRM